MFDSHLRPTINPVLNIIGQKLFKLGISANTMTVIGFICGVFSIVLITLSQYNLAAILFILNRISDGLDGAIARLDNISDFGGFLDIVFDFIIYSGIVFAFGLSDSNNLFYSNILIFSFIGTISSFLAYAIIASKLNINTEKRGKKSFFYLGGICEGFETSFFIISFCLFPNSFINISLIFSALCWLTTCERIYYAWNDFKIK